MKRRTIYIWVAATAFEAIALLFAFAGFGPCGPTTPLGRPALLSQIPFMDAAQALLPSDDSVSQPRTLPWLVTGAFMAVLVWGLVLFLVDRSVQALLLRIRIDRDSH